MYSNKNQILSALLTQDRVISELPEQATPSFNLASGQFRIGSSQSVCRWYV